MGRRLQIAVVGGLSPGQQRAYSPDILDLCMIQRSAVDGVSSGLAAPLGLGCNHNLFDHQVALLQDNLQVLAL